MTLLILKKLRTVVWKNLLQSIDIALAAFAILNIP